MLFASSFLAAFGQALPKIEFKELTHDFGSFQESAGVQTTKFEFTNTGTVPLVLSAVRASCGCTTPTWTREPIAPGKSGSIEVSYNPAGRPGMFTKTVTVTSNAETPNVNLTIQGVCEQKQPSLAELYPRKLGDLMVKNNSVSFVKINQNEIKTESMELVNDTDNPITVSLKQVPSHIAARVVPEVVPAKGKSILSITYEAGKRGDYGLVSDHLYLVLNGKEDYRNAINISATIEEDFSKLTAEELKNAPIVAFDSDSFDFGNMKQGDKVEHTFLLKNNGKRDLIIRKVRTTCGCTAVTPAKTVIPAGDSAPLKVVFDSTGKRGRQSKGIDVITNDPKNPVSTLRIATNVEAES
jgi:hypothetical protein